MNNVDALKIGFLKRAQELNVPKDQLAVLVKKADGEFFKNLSSEFGNYANQAGDWLKNINTSNPADSWKTALVGGLGGAALGGLGTAVSNIGEREEDQGSVIGNALKGALAGGGLGAALPSVKSYLDGFKPKEQAPINVNNNIATPPPAVPQAPGKEQLSAELLGDGAPNPTRGNLTTLLSSLLPGGPSLVNREAGVGDHLYNFAAKPAAGAGVGALLGGKIGGSPKARIIGALLGMFGGNVAGQSSYRNEQADKFTDAARNFTPESLLDNKNIATPARIGLQKSLEEGNPSRILDAIRGLSSVAPEKEIPEQFSVVQDMANREDLPGWYNSNSSLQNLANIFRKK